MCLCDSLPTIATQTAVVVIQHPHERMHPLGTAKLLKLSMPNARVHTVSGGIARDLHCRIDIPEDAVLLYPHPSACELDQLGPKERPSTLVVLDGTWAHSRQLYRANPWLQKLRHVHISPDAPSRYRIRREPRADYLSTLEATVEALRVVEPDAPDFAPLLAAFDRMIERQIQHSDSVGPNGRRKRPRQRASRRTSPLLANPDLVVLYAESSLPGGDPSATRELVQIVAARCGSGETFETIVRPSNEPPAAHHLAHMQLKHEQLATGDPPQIARQRLRDFVGDDPVAAWTTSSLDWTAVMLREETGRFELKANYCNLRNRGAGLLEHLVQREGLTPQPVSCHGRARDRLAHPQAAAGWMRQLGRATCS